MKNYAWIFFLIMLFTSCANVGDANKVLFSDEAFVSNDYKNAETSKETTFVELKEETSEPKSELEIVAAPNRFILLLDEPSSMELKNSGIPAKKISANMKASTDIKNKIRYEAKKSGIKINSDLNKVVNALVVEGKESDIYALKNSNEEIKAIIPDYFYSATLQDVPSIVGSDALNNIGYSGDGISVAVLDTGTDYRHEALGNCIIPDNEWCDGGPAPGANISSCRDESITLCNYDISQQINDWGGVSTAFDSCSENNDLLEGICNENGIDFLEINCPAGCSGGRCKYFNIDPTTLDCEFNIQGSNFVECSTFNMYTGECLSPLNDLIDFMDYNGHGTHVASIIAGKGSLKGIAPGVDLRSYKVLNGQGVGLLSWILEGFERAMDPNNDGDFSDAANIISMSLGGAETTNPVLEKAINEAVISGTLVVVAAGNSGDKNYLYYNNINSPGAAKLALTVGASDKFGKLAYYSGRGSTLNNDILIKPDVVAPGSKICAAQSDLKYGTDCFTEKYASISGTSMATPVVSAIAALIMEARPELSATDIRSLLINSAESLQQKAEQGNLLTKTAVEQLTSKELCTHVSLNKKIDFAEVTLIDDYDDVSDFEIAYLRNDLNHYPDEILLSSSFNPDFYNETTMANFSNIPIGDYWLCAKSNKERIMGMTKKHFDNYIFNSTSNQFEIPNFFGIDYQSDIILKLTYDEETNPLSAGSGIVNAENSLEASLVFNPTQINLGRNPSEAKRIFVKNVGSDTITLSIQTTNFERFVDYKRERVYENIKYPSPILSSETLIMPPGSTNFFDINLASIDSLSEGLYGGYILINDQFSNYRIPYDFAIFSSEDINVPFSNFPINLDGVKGSKEWIDAVSINNEKTLPRTLFLFKTANFNQKPYLFVGVESKGYEGINLEEPFEYSIDLFFDEGSNTEFGSGSRDNQLTYLQEDWKIFTNYDYGYGDAKSQKADGYKTSDGWFAIFSPSESSIDLEAFGSILSEGGYVEFAIPLKGTEGFEPASDWGPDVSDLNLELGDSVGFAYTGRIYDNNVYYDIEDSDVYIHNIHSFNYILNLLPPKIPPKKPVDDLPTIS